MSWFDDKTCLDTTIELQNKAWDNFWADAKRRWIAGNSPEYELWSDWIMYLLDKNNARFCYTDAGYRFVKFETAEDKMMFMLRWL